MKHPFFSVIIPTLNEERYLPYLLNDLTTQSGVDFETIVSDANSEDKTREVVESYKNKLKISFISVNKKSVAYQRNYGAKYANGKYLIFFDADMRINRLFIKKIANEIKKFKYLILIPSIEPDESMILDKMVFKFINSLIELSQFTKKPFASGGAMILQRQYFLFLGCFNEKLFMSEDHEIIQRAKKGGVMSKFLMNIPVTFSLRRFRHEGKFRVLIKYILAFSQLLRVGGVEKKIFDYQMGGGQYKLDQDKKRDIFSNFNDHLNKLKKYLKE